MLRVHPRVRRPVAGASSSARCWSTPCTRSSCWRAPTSGSARTAPATSRRCARFGAQYGFAVEPIDDVCPDDGESDASHLVDLDPRAARGRSRARGARAARETAQHPVAGRARRAARARARLSDRQPRPRHRGDAARRRRVRRVGDGRRCAVRRRRVDRQQPDVRRHPAAPGRGAPARPEARPVRHDHRAGVRRSRAGRCRSSTPSMRWSRSCRRTRRASARSSPPPSPPAPPRGRTGTAPGPRRSRRALVRCRTPSRRRWRAACGSSPRPDRQGSPQAAVERDGARGDRVDGERATGQCGEAPAPRRAPRRAPQPGRDGRAAPRPRPPSDRSRATTTSVRATVARGSPAMKRIDRGEQLREPRPPVAVTPDSSTRGRALRGR